LTLLERQLNQSLSRQTKRATGDVLNQSLDAGFISCRQVHGLINAEAGMLPRTHILDDVGLDLTFSQIEFNILFSK
jgi:hypothetical protein